MKWIFVELPPFARYRDRYLDDESFRCLQNVLMNTPDAGAVIEGTGGLRKLRFSDRRRGKGKRGGIRVIYYRWLGGRQFWLFSLYDKNEVRDLTFEQKKILKSLLDIELTERASE